MGPLTHISPNLLQSSPLILLEWKEEPGRPLVAGALELLARMGRTIHVASPLGFPLDSLLTDFGKATLDNLLSSEIASDEPEGIIHAGRISCAEVDASEGWGFATEQVWLELTIEWRRVEGGGIECTAAAVDISHTVAVEHERARQAERLELVVEGTRLGTWDWEPKTGAVTINQHWMEMLGETFVTPNIHVDDWSSRVHPEDLAGAMADINAHIAGDTPFYENIHRMRHAGGSWVYVLDRGMVVERDDEGNVVRFSGTHTNITSQKEAELAAQDAAKSKSVFLATMSHEIRTPLHGILGMLQVLEGTQLNGDQVEATRLAATSGEHLLVLINDILEISKIEAGEFQLDPQPFEVIGWLDTISNLFRSRADEKSIAFEVDPGLESATWVQADDHRLRQVVGNLVSNAIKFTEDGRVRVEAELGERRLSVRVVDTGKGIANTERIWKSFSQEDASVSRRHGGTGLGLSLCQQIVTLMGGEIGVDSVVGEGSTFHFWVPVERVEAPADAAADPAEDEGITFDHLRVLIAEDNPVNRRVASGIFKRVGLQVEFAEDGQVAVERCRAETFDVVFMDLHMPVLDGFDATVQILEEHGDAAPRIVALSADLTEEARDRCDELGFDGHLGKPFRVAELEKELRASVA